MKIRIIKKTELPGTCCRTKKALSLTAVRLAEQSRINALRTSFVSDTLARLNTERTNAKQAFSALFTDE